MDQFRNFLVMILIVASVISLLLGDFIEAAAIMAIVALNAILGVVQESKAEESLAELTKIPFRRRQERELAALAV